MDYDYYRPTGGPMCNEMLQKTSKDTIFSLRYPSQAWRPISVATDIVDTDSETEDPSKVEDNSFRLSSQSSGPPSFTSFTTASSYDEVSTPLSSLGVEAFPELNVFKQVEVEGPRGPHLFRNSTGPPVADEDVVLTLAPLTPKTNRDLGDLLARSPLPPQNSRYQYHKYTDSELDYSQLVLWTPEMVAQWMLNAGIEPYVADCFLHNDISGAILITLKFEDLREIGIQSFGIRTNIWHQIQALCDSRPSPPRQATPIEDASSSEARQVTEKEGGQEVGRRQGRRRRLRRRISEEEDAIHPMDSASIIGIEQYLPKPHRCAKGQSCAKWKKNEKIMQEFRKLNPTVDVRNGGSIMIYGDAGNPDTARAIDPNETMRPTSDAVPSVVASSDVLGPGGIPPLQYLQEASKRNDNARDTRDKVRRFLDFQQKPGNSDQVPPTPPFELAPLPASKPAHQGLRHLPKLSIPSHPQQYRPAPLKASTVPQPAESQLSQYRQRQSPAQSERNPVQPEVSVPYRMDKSASLSPDLETCRNPYRFGTPFSEMDVPVTSVPIGPVSRDASQSVPPNMNYQAVSRSNPVSHSRSQSQTSARRPSISVLPAVNEDASAHQSSKTPPSKSSSPVHHAQQQPQQKPLQAPPRCNYPWSPVDRTKFKQAIPSLSSIRRDNAIDPPEASDSVTYQGPMKKRKTRLLRNEWHDGYFTLRGTRLNMHKNVTEMDRTLEYIDIDDYAIACSSLASTSKLSAAFKAVHISHNRKMSEPKSDPVGAFSFQLIPQDKNAGLRLRKRDSFMSGMSGTSSSEGVNGTGKTHHFAVKGRDERIDWMRELMLAKAMKQKSEGFEISVNGNMI
ncbi:hypothetical protein E4U42_007542 [Claviceps africana]|uniref:SAM and PH domain-containing protein n=1 Tax=Claviceps africana TaxID=83212 RepID=A0A8K0JDG1_9HYPO|nr:hypothetical protein E4U42_007542 [Claviceps africana]